MSTADLINDDFIVLEEETMRVAEEVAAHQRKLMEPVWYKRREMAKKIDGFWGQAVSLSVFLIRILYFLIFFYLDW
jgi:hypothetical protein